MHPNEYQKLTKKTEIYSDAAERFIQELLFVIPVVSITEPFMANYEEFLKCLKLMYCTGKLNGEAGEAAEIVFKSFRGNLGVLTDQEKILLAKEMGDVLWYVARISDLIEYDLETIMQMNIDKLMDRKDRNLLHGYGDER